MSEAKEPKWIRFLELPRTIGRKTKEFQVTTKSELGRDEHVLGRVGWFGAFRKFAFFPSPHTAYEQDCLRDLAKFCEDQTREYKERKKVGAP